MPTVRINGADLYYEELGVENEEAILFSHGLLMSGDMFRAQAEALAGDYRCVLYDHRGQGRSEIPDVRSIDMERVYEDAVSLIATLGLAPCHFVGLSMGGFVGQRLAARRPDLVRSLVLLDTSAEAEPAESRKSYRVLNTIARLGGLPLVAPKVLPILFGKSFLTDPERGEDRRRWEEWLRARPRRIYRAVNGILERKGVLEELPGIQCPTLVLVGEEDVATPPARSERIHAQIPGSKLGMIPRAGHSSPIEAPEAVTAAIREFLAALPEKAD